MNQQLAGLAPLFERCQDKSVLDLGCAEGVISHLLVKHGAANAHGVDIIPEYIKMANKWAGGNIPWALDPERRKPPKNFVFEVQDLNTWQPIGTYDIVLALASLHKVRNPSEACERYADAAKELMVIRVPPGNGEMIVDQRSGMVPHDLGRIMRAKGFKLLRSEVGTFNEITHYYERVPA